MSTDVQACLDKFADSKEVLDHDTCVLSISREELWNLLFDLIVDIEALGSNKLVFQREIM